MSNFNNHSWRIDRRHFLRGLGASIALPLLDCMEPPTRRRDDAPSTPKRSVFLYIPNGVNTLEWQIERAGADYTLTVPLQPLEAQRSNLTFFSGLHHPNGIGRAHQCEKIWLTGASIGQDGGRLGNSVSADQLMAEVAGQHTRFPSLELAITGGTLAWSRQGVPLPAERKPRVIFERLFGADAGGTEATRARLARRASVLDVVLGDARKLRGTIGTDDRTKLDEYLSAVRDVEQRTERANAWLDVPKPKVAPEQQAKLTRQIPDSDAGDYYRTMYDLIALALRTDMTRVVTCVIGSESRALALPELGIRQARHELSHHNGIPEKMRRLTRMDTFLTTQLAYFLDELAAHDEQGESLLDRTMVLFGSGMAYGHSHGNANLPLVLAGGTSLGLRHGQHVDFNLPKIGQYDLSDPSSYYSVCLQPVDPQARMSNLLLTMLRRMGAEVDTFADSARTLSEIVV